MGTFQSMKWIFMILMRSFVHGHTCNGTILKVIGCVRHYRYVLILVNIVANAERLSYIPSLGAKVGQILPFPRY